MYMPTEEDPDKEVETSCKKLVPVFNELSFVNRAIHVVKSNQRIRKEG